MKTILPLCAFGLLFLAIAVSGTSAAKPAATPAQPVAVPAVLPTWTEPTKPTGSAQQQIVKLKAELAAEKAKALGWYKQSPQYKATLQPKQQVQQSGGCANGQCYSPRGRRGRR